MSEHLHELAERYWSLMSYEAPIIAIAAGQDPSEDVLLRESPNDYDRRARGANKLLGELTHIDFAALSPADQASALLLRRELLRVDRLYQVKSHLRPSLYPVGPEFWLSYFAGQVALATTKQGSRYLARLRSVPEGLRGLRESLTLGRDEGMRYARLAVERAITNLRSQLAVPATTSSFYGPLARAVSRSDSFAPIAKEGLEVITKGLYSAFSEHADFLEKELLPVARDSLACTEDVNGNGFYRALIESNVTLAIEPEDLHELGLAEVERLEHEMAAVAGSAGFEQDLTGFQTKLKGDNRHFAASAQALREEMEVLAKRIDARLPEFFGHLPRMTYGIQSMPKEMAAKMPPAFAQPNPANRTSAGIFFITSIPEKCPRYLHVPLVMHEAWPGHLMHLALVQEMEGLPAFRRHGSLNYTACLEGWALYCEGLGEEFGLYDTPEKRYGRLETEMWRAVRLVVDTGIHAKGWSREQAIAYFSEKVAMAELTIEAEIDRYIAMPAQALAYQVGNIRFREIRRRAEQRLGAHFNIRDFHDALMTAGPATLEILDQIMDGWIEERAAAAA